jgi:EAL domain-containing protein (putative c-di-GMP-specific phosphodiesterase class I)/GGDEF domain-containing protein
VKPSIVPNSSETWITGAYRRLIEAIGGAISEGKEGTLIVVSIDNLAMIMCHYDGHFVDDMLSHINEEIATCTEHRAIVIQTQHDQFSVLLDYRQESDVVTVTEAIHIAMQRFAAAIHENPLFVMASMGSADFPQDGDSPRDVVDHAYVAVSHAKELPGFYCSYARATKHFAQAKSEMLSASTFQRAILEERLRLAYQPVICSKTGKVAYYECLLRIVDNHGTIISAGPYIEVAERMGLIDSVDCLVLKMVVKELREHDNVLLAFNVSNQAVDNPRWLEQAEKLLSDESLSSRLIVEVTETGSQRDLRRMAFFIASLQALGCQVALDDFGSGYTSFRQLKALPVDIIKIDGSFVKDMVDNYDNQLFVKTLLDFTNSFGLKTVAEYVETGEIAKSLMDLKVDYLQGHYFSAAMNNRPWVEQSKNK